MAEFFQQSFHAHFNFWIYVILMMIGLWALIAKNNLIKKLIGMSIFQTAIILFYVSLGVKAGATIPILDPYGNKEQAAAYAEESDSAKKKNEKKGAVEKGNSSYVGKKSPNPDIMANPLPHVLMLTAIVVGVATLGVALSIAQMIFKEFGSLEEDEILEIVKGGNVDD